MKNNRARVLLLFGKSYTGKTARMVHELQSERRVILVDPKCAQLAKLKGWSHVWPEVVELKNGRGHFSDSTMADALRKVKGGEFRMVVHLRHSQRLGLELLCRLVMAVKDCVVAVDELGLFVPPGSAGALPRNITSVVVSGTHDGIRLIGTAQRPSLVHKTLRANAERMLFYRVTEKYDIDIVNEYLPKDWSGQSVETLPDYVCIDYRDGEIPFVDASYAGKLNTLPGKRF